MRDRAARLLAIGMGAALLILILAIGIGNVRGGSQGLSDEATQLLLGTTTLLVGAVSGYLSRRAIDDDLHGPVGLILTVTLGGVILLMCGMAFVDAILAEGPGISGNTSNILASLFGGVIGAAAAYLGLTSDREEEMIMSEQNTEPVEPTEPDVDEVTESDETVEYEKSDEPGGVQNREQES